MDVKYAWTQEIHGYNVSRGSINEAVVKFRTSFKIEREFLISQESILRGIDWSIQQLNSSSS